jgi:ABC-type multidrug transport system ATPase subunit
LVLQVAELTKSYGHLTALSEVSFSIRPGEVLGVIGPNGSGKTTLFEWLGGVLPADRGIVLDAGPFDSPAHGLAQGRPFDSPARGLAQARPFDSPTYGLPQSRRVLTDQERSARFFYLPDGIAPWPAQTVRWALKFIVGFFGPAKSPARAGRRISIDDVVRQLDLTPLLDSPLGTLSKGQRKRALLAVGLLTPQPILLADEPFDGLDLRQSRDVARTLREHAAAGRTLLLSIHQLADAARVCDRFVLLSGARIRGEGTKDELSALAASRGAASTDLEEVFLALT